MNLPRVISAVALLGVLAGMGRGEQPDLKGFEEVVKPYFGQFCTKCHGPKKQKAKLTLHDLEAEFTAAGSREKWADVFDMLALGEMPPEEEKQPEARLTGRVVSWIQGELEKAGHVAQDKRRHPAFGNYVDHDELFNAAPVSVPKPPPRLWRIRPASYDRALQQVAKGSYTTPFTLNTSSGGFQDYAHLYKLDDGSLGLLLGNARVAAERMTSFRIQDGKITRGSGWSTPGQILAILDPKNATPSEEQLVAAVDWQFHRVLLREGSEQERERMVGFLRTGMEKNGALLGLRNMIQAVLLTPEALYRSELGTGEADEHGRVRLSPREIAYAVSYALTDARPDGTLFKAAEEGQLASAEGVAEQVQRILDEARIAKPRLLDLFREYFGYPGALDVFKDEKLFPQHRAKVLVSDTDRLVQHILELDRDVFRELLTTQKSFVNYAYDAKRGPRRSERNRMIHLSYNLPPDWKFEANQPIELPGEQRAGILTQPSWLVAKSDNFDNHAILRGKWVRERLLGGTIPDLPITVDAQLPDEPHETLRHRMRVTRESECWRCHERMNPLGMSFEIFDHFGRWRPFERVLDKEATAANVDSKGKPRGEIHKRALLDSRGLVAMSGDPTLEGGVDGAIELIHKLAKSDRVRQVWIRHVFRYFMGRNETLDDAVTLQAADKAYLESGGSFKALVTVLLTSDSFLMRSAE